MEGSSALTVSGRNAEKNREKKPRVYTPLDIQELIQDLALYREQTLEYFKKVRGLSGEGLNPKEKADVACVTAEDIEEVWGKVSSFKTTNTKLHPDTRRELIELYAKIYGTTTVTNNEWSGWVVKGYICESKNKKVDWATAAASTAKEKADRCERELTRARMSDSANSTGANSSGGLPKRSGGVSGCSKPGFTSSSKPVGFGKVVSSKSGILSTVTEDHCRRGVTESDIAEVEDVLKVEIGLLDSANSKVQFLDSSRKRETDRIIGLRYSMDDRKSAARDAEDNVRVVDSKLKSLDAGISAKSQTVSSSFIFLCI